MGVTVVAALQDPRKEVLPARDLFPTRIGLRMVDPDQVDMVLGAGARNRGARCDRISEALPGVGYVGVDGVAEPVRVRFAYLDDDHIAAMIAPLRHRHTERSQLPAPRRDRAGRHDPSDARPQQRLDHAVRTRAALCAASK